jgi:lipoate-protein ligase A
MEHLVSSFTSSYGLRPGGVTAEEMERANTLAVEKFATPEWFHRVP